MHETSGLHWNPTLAWVSMSHYDDAPEETEDRFHAQFDSREVKLMTLDELQAAFEAGEIHENTFVCREGDSEWLTLAVVAGLGEEEPEPQPVVERRPPMPNRAPDGVEMRPPMPNRAPDLGATRPPMPNRPPDVGASRPPMPNRPPDTGEVRPPMPNRRPELNTIPASRQVSAYPPVASARNVGAPSTPLSFAPVTSNINYPDTDLDELSLRPKRRVGRIVGAVVAIGIIGGGAAFAANGGLHNFALPSMGALQGAASHSQASLTLSNIEAKPAPVSPPAAPPPAPEPVAAVTPPAPASDAPAAPAATPGGFSDDMKQALLAADNNRKTKHASKVKGRAATVRHGGGSRPAGGSSGFKSGGSAYDPLNGKL